MKTVYVFLATGFEEIEAITTIDLLRRAEIEVCSVSVTDSLEVEGAHGIHLKADLQFKDLQNISLTSIEALVLPGGTPGHQNLARHEDLGRLLKEFNAQEGRIAAICAAPMVLGGLGLLQEKTAVCYPGYEANLNSARIGTNPVEVDGNIITSRGPGTANGFALKLVELIKGKPLAEEIRKKAIIA